MQSVVVEKAEQRREYVFFYLQSMQCLIGFVSNKKHFAKTACDWCAALKSAKSGRNGTRKHRGVKLGSVITFADNLNNVKSV